MTSNNNRIVDSRGFWSLLSSINRYLLVGCFQQANVIVKDDRSFGREDGGLDQLSLAKVYKQIDRVIIHFEVMIW